MIINIFIFFKRWQYFILFHFSLVYSCYLGILKNECNLIEINIYLTNLWDWFLLPVRLELVVKYSSCLTSTFSSFYSKTCSPVSRPPSPRPDSSSHPHREGRIWGWSDRKSDWKAKRPDIRKRPRWWGGGRAWGWKRPAGDRRHRNRRGQTCRTEESAEVPQGTNGQRKGQRTKRVLFWWCHNISFWSGMSCVFHNLQIELNVINHHLTFVLHCNRKLRPTSWARQRPLVRPQCLSEAASWIYMVSS